MKNIEVTKYFKLSVIEYLESIDNLISYDDHDEFEYYADLIVEDFDYLLDRLRHSEKERFNES